MADTAIRESTLADKDPANDDTLSPTSITALDRVRSLLILIAERKLVSSQEEHEQHVEESCNWLRELHVVLVDTSHRLGRVKDDFRLAGGFSILLGLTGHIPELWAQADAKQSLFELLKLALGVLCEALIEHRANLCYFTELRGGNGWLHLQNHMLALRDNMVRFESQDVDWQRKLLNLLFSFALRQDLDGKVLHSNATKPEDSSTSSSVRSKYGTRQAIIWIPEAIFIIAKLWLAVVQSSSQGNQKKNPQDLSFDILDQLLRLACGPPINGVSLTEAGITRLVCAPGFDELLDSKEVPSLEQLRQQLLKIGLLPSKETYELCKDALSGRDKSLKLIREAARASQQPPHLVFDLSLHGYAALEIGALHGVFPPQARGGGYTFMAWVCVDEFDDKCHTTLFGASDRAHECFLLVYLERESKRLVLQISTKSEVPSVRFKSSIQSLGRWYHIAIVHQRHSTENTSRATLLLNGTVMERVKCPFPSQPAANRSKSALGVQLGTPPVQLSTVQAFVGTPKSLAPRLGTGMLHSRWSLASCQLIAQPLHEELILVYKSLGPEFVGNFQDSLGSFQTYDTSTQLSLVHERLGETSSDESVISKAIRGRASHVNHEGHIYLNFIAAAYIQTDVKDDARRSPCASMTMMRPGFLNLSSSTQHPSQTKKQIWRCQGGVRFSSARSFGHFAWRTCGGVALAIKLLEAAKGDNDILESIKFIFEVVQNNWRISEAFERESAFPVMALIVRSKGLQQRGPTHEHQDIASRGSFSLHLLKVILQNVGYSLEDPASSLISNPLAYRALVIDSDLWRTADGVSQKLYYQHYVDLITRSRYASFNIKRLSRMRPVKRLMNALKSGEVESEGLPPMLEALKALLVHLPSSEAYRSTALYITYALTGSQYRKAFTPQTPTNDNGQVPQGLQISGVPGPNPSTPSTISNRQIRNDKLPSYEIGINVLQVFAELLFEDTEGVHLRKFARTVTNKWLLYLLSCEHDAIVGPAMRILARLLVLQGPSYLSKFQDTSYNFKILATRLRRWWSIGAVWQSCFAVMFGIDPHQMFMKGDFEYAKIREAVRKRASRTLYCPAIFSVMIGLLEMACSRTASVKTMTNHHQEDLNDATTAGSSDADRESFQGLDLITKILRLFKELYAEVPPFRDLCTQPDFSQQMMRCIFAGVSGVNSALSPGEEARVKDIRSVDTTLQMETGDASALVQRYNDSTVAASDAQQRRRRQSSFVLVPTKESFQALTSTAVHTEDMPGYESDLVTRLRRDEPLVLSVDILVRVLTSRVMDQKDFTGLGLFHRAPPSSFNLRASINSYLIRETMQHLQSNLAKDSSRFNDPRTLMNVVKYTLQVFEAYMEGWYTYGAMNLVRFGVAFLQHWQRADVQSVKDVRLCLPSLRTMKNTLGRTILFHIGRAQDVFEGLQRLSSLASTVDYECILSAAHDDQENHLESLFFAILRILPQADGTQCDHAQSVLRALTERNSVDFLGIMEVNDAERHTEIIYEFMSALHGSRDAFMAWLQEHMHDIEDVSMYGKDNILLPFIAQAESAAATSMELRAEKRKERIEQWHLEDLTYSHAWTEHQIAARNWTDNISKSEVYKYQRSLQDQHESHDHTKFNLSKLMEPLERLGLEESYSQEQRWQLDECEGRDRMRLRISPMKVLEEVGYEPKDTKTFRRKTQSISSGARSKDVASPQTSTPNLPSISQPGNPRAAQPANESLESVKETFEIVTEQNNNEEEEDKNRKVMRSLQRGEQVMNAYNVSRIIGLEAHEGLLIIGKGSLYLVDGLFQRADGEVVNVDQAPEDERDQYVRILSGHEVDSTHLLKKIFEPTRHWPWSEALSFSKRNFLTRPVAIEAFFTDGRSYLLTTGAEEHRNALYNDLLSSSSKIQDLSQVESEAAWRRELLKNPTEGSSKLSSILSPMIANPMTKKWIKGEVSNFHYLMWVNSQAGRTFNDLTQYPVFPWVLADYTSEELDLSNPRSFRDLSKPMGCQTIERSESFRERYNTLAEMDEQTPPFHYGTHYSSAMIVTSFLIRLQPFTQSHVLLQGGSFDHANRLFHSVEQDWRSASREGLSDVRELIPEFFFLSDFLVNVNKYNFGYRQGDNENVDNVKLPPWAKGSPDVFIAKHREALESPFVSQYLHAWIDLIFGFKQRGEAARESTNVFHYLSYPGAKDLDSIEDQHERAATIGIIHNFGQTPRQIFIRPHDRREQVPSRSAKLRESMRSLAKLRSPTHQIPGGVSALHFSRQLIAAAALTCLAPPSYDIIADFGYPDHSLRFWNADHRKQLGLHEQLHDGAITCAAFADSSTLFTGGDDTTVSAWKVDRHDGSIELHIRRTLFGHRAIIQTIAVSRAFSVLLTADAHGKIILWDLGRLDFIREIDIGLNLHTARISESSGRILVGCGANLQIYNINGRLLLDQLACDEHARISTCVFYQQTTNAWYDSEIVLSGHSGGTVKVWDLQTTKEGIWVLQQLNRLPTDRFVKGVDTPAITALLARDGKVYAGDKMGWVYEWNAVR